jgi:hypothetical protein
MTIRTAGEGEGIRRNGCGRATTPGAVRRRRFGARLACWRRRAWLPWFAALLWLGGCASPPDAVIDNDPEAFSAGIDAILKTGMSIHEAHQLLQERLPKPSLRSQVVAPVPTRNQSTRTRRFMIGWPTRTPGVTLVLTIFCDRDGTIVRWTTGPLNEGH